VKTFIAVLTMDERFHASIGTLFFEAGKRDDIEVFVLNGIQGHANARNHAVQKFKKTNCDRLWFIDDDMDLPENIWDLLEVDAAIVSPYLPTIKRFRDESKNIPIVSQCARQYDDLNDWDTYHGVDADQEIMDVDGVGMACTVIRRDVLTNRNMWGPTQYLRPDGKHSSLQSSDPRPLFEPIMKPNGENEIGEDYHFCWKARKQGYDIKLHTGIICGHRKNIDILSLKDMTHEIMTLRLMRKSA
jgi:hypothetical protein